MATPFPGIAQVQIQSLMDDGQAVVNSWHIVDPGLGTGPDLTTITALAHEWWTYFSSTYLALASDNLTVQQVVCRQVEDPLNPGPILEAQYPVGAAGTRPAGARRSPMSLCGIASLKTPVASRRFRGHTFLPPCDDTNSLDGNNLDLSQAYAVAATAFIAKLQTGCAPTVTWTGTNLSAWRLSIYSKRAAEAGLLQNADVSLVSLKPKVSYLRSRERGGS